RNEGATRGLLPHRSTGPGCGARNRPKGAARRRRRHRGPSPTGTWMSGAALDRVFRAASGRIVGALAARFRDIALAEDACAEACARALEQWPATTVPEDPAAWLYQVAVRIALDALRRRKTHQQYAPLLRENDEEPEIEEETVIPDERLRLIFICCHS